ncbi:MAG: hypothetical protein KGL44_07840 [Sphingomonadales bacterium]|nr:hypothetical protein [Sphingomonadales bacterium]
MTMNTQVATLRIAREVREAEDALAEALIRQSNLFTLMLTTRRDAEVGPFTGQDILLRLAGSQQSLLAAGNDLARVHGKLRDLAVERGDSNIDMCPPESGSVIEHPASLALAA